jgi:hypothetical protein
MLDKEFCIIDNKSEILQNKKTLSSFFKKELEAYEENLKKIRFDNPAYHYNFTSSYKINESSEEF